MDEYTISLPILYTFESPDGLLQVTTESDQALREALEQFARYFKKEMHYDFIQYEANEHLYPGSVKYVGWLFSEVAHDHLEEDEPTPYRLYGGCCFRWREWSDHKPSWALDWIWLHPLFRGQGMLARNWRALREHHGDFIVQQPITNSMKRFLEKIT